jgi:hypothetical protein
MNDKLLDQAVAKTREKKGKDESSIRSAFAILHDVNSETFLQFLDRTALLSRKEMLFFWQSEYSTKHAQALLKDLRGPERLVAYFSKNEHANADFIRGVFEVAPELLYRTARMCSIYDRNDHIKSLSFLSVIRNSPLSVLYKELRFLNDLWHRWQNDELFYSGVLCQYSYSEILVHFTSYYEKWKRSAPEALNNKMLNGDMEVTLLCVLDMILSAKLQTHYKNEQPMLAEPSIQECKKLLEDSLPTINPPEGILKNKYLPDEQVDDHKKLLRETIRFYFDFHQFHHYANMYSGGYADFLSIEGKEGAILTNPLWFEWRRNDFKVRQLKDLMHRAVIDRFDDRSFPSSATPPEREVLMGTALDQENWKFLSLCPKLISQEGVEINAVDCFQVLRTLSKVLKPPGRHIAHSEKDPTFHVMRQQFPQHWRDFSEPAYMVVFTEEELNTKLVSLLGWETARIAGVLSLLTNNLSSFSDQAVVVSNRPFLKTENLIFWLSSFYSDREWYQLFLASVQTDKNIRFGCKQNHLGEFEIAAYFNKAGFKAIAEYEIKSATGDRIAVPDTLAFRDNALFIVEYKLSHHDSDVSKAGRQQVKVFDYLAKTQIETTESWLSANLDMEQGEELRTLLGITSPFAELNVVPMIVTNNFEHDGLLIDNRIRSITLYELSVVLRNNLYDNLHAPFEKMMRLYTGTKDLPKSSTKEEFMLPFEFAHSMNNSRSPFVRTGKRPEYTKENCDLWEGKADCSAARFLEIIDQELVWKFLDQSYRYGELMEMTLKPFDRQMGTVLY